MCSTTNNHSPKDITCVPISDRHPYLSASQKKSLPRSKRLLTAIKLITARFLEHFLPKQDTTQKSTLPLPSLCHHEQSAIELSSQENQREQRDCSILHLRLRQAERDTMPDRTEKDVIQEPRSDNYHYQIVALKDHFLSQIPPEHVYYQLTMQFRRDTLDRTAYKEDSVKNVVETVYKRINEAFVHPKHYAQEPHRQLMPYLLAMIEFDDNVLFHTHCLLAVHPLLAEQFDDLRIYDKFQRFDPRITQSHFDRTIIDAKDIKAFDDPTNVSKFVNYMLKRNKNHSMMPKRPDHLLMFAPKS